MLNKHMYTLADSQPKSIGLVSGLTATRSSGYIHQVNRVNSRNYFGLDDGTINIVVVIIIFLFLSPPAESRMQEN